MSRGFQRAGVPALDAVLARLDALVNLERADRSRGTPGAAAIRRVDLEPARDLLARLGAPERRFRAVHVAGTKGKGSVAALVAQGLARAGFQVGLYTSPHVERVHERVQLGGALQAIDDTALAIHLARALDVRDAAVRESTAARDATWFDTLTAAAFDAFAAAGVAWAVVEVGLGGRLDSTNALDGEVCLVTNIDLEHTAILGDTRAAIAAEKGGIFKRGAACLTGVQPGDAEAGDVLERAAAAVGAALVRVPQAGPLAARNRALARAVLDALWARGVRAGEKRIGGHLLPDGALPGLPGRLERRLAEGVPVVLDGAHVPSSLRAVLDELEADSELPGFPVAVFGTARDKDLVGLLKALRGRVDRVFCTSTGTGPARTPEELLRGAAELGMAAEAVSSPADALRAALGRAQPDGWVLVTGSLHLVGAVRGLLPPPRPEDHACSRSSPTSS
jgi:dihydrofolate synthase/folylpolyglutamate synthase